MEVGFTGTQDGMTPAQRDRVRDLLLVGSLVTSSQVAHHGDCVGADAQFHAILRKYGPSVDGGWLIVGHPPDDESRRAFCDFDVTTKAKPYLDRNREIALACDLLIAAPKSLQEERRSGTWATVRYAREMGRPIILVGPNGAVVIDQKEAT